MANSVDPDQTAPIGAVCSRYTLFASILNSSVILNNYLHQTTSADDIFKCIFFLGALILIVPFCCYVRGKYTIYECHICNISKSELVPCEDPESFVRGGLTLTLFFFSN